MKRGKPKGIIYRHLKSKKSPYVTVSVRISKDQLEYFKSRAIEISPIVRELLDAAIKDIENE